MLKLQDYLEAPDFDAAVTELGTSIRQALNLPPIFQLGLVVPDAEAAARDLARQGITAVFEIDATPTMCIVRRCREPVCQQTGIRLPSRLRTGVDSADARRHLLRPRSRSPG